MKYPNIEKTQLLDDRKQIIEQNNENITIYNEIYNSETKQFSTEEKTTGKIIAFDSFNQIAKILTDTNNIIWYDYKHKTFDTSKYEKEIIFQMKYHEDEMDILNFLSNLFNIVMSATTLHDYKFYFENNPEISNNIYTYCSNEIKGFKISTNISKLNSIKHLNMKLISPQNIMFDIIIDYNFQTANKGEMKIFNMNEISSIIFSRIKSFIASSSEIQISALV